MNRITADLSALLAASRYESNDRPTTDVHVDATRGQSVGRPILDTAKSALSAASCDATPRAAHSILDALGVAALICTPAAQVTFATVAARMLLTRGDAIRLTRQPGGSEVLATSDRQSTMRLARSISMAAAGLSPTMGGGGIGGCTLAVSRSDDAAPLVLAIAPFAATAAGAEVAPGLSPAHALIVVSDPDAEDGEFALRIQSAFGLTRAETRLAVALARGICRKEYARSIGVQPSTVKTQITNLFAKTGTRRESDLVRILTSVPRLAWPGR